MSSDSTESCGFEGNPDLYGLGIRIGYYTQTLASWFANWFVLSEVVTLRKTNTLFLCAAIIALIVYVAHSGDVYAIEGFAPLQIGVVLGTITISRETSRTDGLLRVSVLQLATFLVLQLATHGYSLYFWSHGVEAMKPTPCGTYIFLFARLSLKGPVRYVMLGFSAFLTFYNVVIIMPWRFSTLLRSFGIRESRKHFELWAEKSWKNERDETLPTVPERLSLEKIYEAEAYLDALFAPVPKEKDALRIVKPIRDTRVDWSWKGVCRSLRGNWQLFKVNTFDFASTKPRIILATHFRELPPPKPTWVVVVGRMVEERKRGPQPNWHVLGIASEIQISQTPLKTQVFWKRQAIGQFCFIVFLIVQIEATLVWNSIYGISEVRSVGQLIPFIVGLGGLSNVLWEKRKQLRKARPRHAKAEPEPTSSFQDAVRVYLDWKAQKYSQTDGGSVGEVDCYAPGVGV
jgi:hypothetical protein